jgi:hypothetical protein
MYERWRELKKQTSIYFESDLLLKMKHKCLDEKTTLTDYITSLVLKDLENKDSKKKK